MRIGATNWSVDPEARKARETRHPVLWKKGAAGLPDLRINKGRMGRCWLPDLDEQRGEDGESRIRQCLRAPVLHGITQRPRDT